MDSGAQTIIRPLRRDDEHIWRELWEGYLTFYKTTLPAEVYASTFARLLGDDDHDFSGLIAERNGVPVGLTHYLFHRHCWRIENVCYLQDLYAAPAVRGIGVGRKLIEAVYQAADDAGVSNVYWLTQDDNVAGRQLYDRVGQITNFIKYQRPT
ncbi:GNAT family N-acetyltransferase [Yoonia sediminilitoris]|uniref:Ribosomal protein S18 acetylase RimI-like enzyme n=1 Tax=Yoonia sediminilitoris TaxID=1286148 RepID=A0A2T6KRL2_9RHOB|nr:GNAT family N-acetyltransferase [Yoonia sediminilitoris]PUB19198.1 ribosomal protein S18 acetylase RimI-like enzyme [Yoonia sediminilitoris]RCW99366.1 ribosomal protein S18 acetylase RimI-like enzyme [Yoonia sediminilitoris]